MKKICLFTCMAILMLLGCSQKDPSLVAYPENLMFRWFHPVKGEFYAEGKTIGNQQFSSEKGQPSVLIVSKPRI